MSQWILLYAAFCTIIAISLQKEARRRDYALLLHPARDRYVIPANTRQLINAGIMLAHRLRRCPSINPPLDHRAAFAGCFSTFRFYNDVFIFEEGVFTEPLDYRLVIWRLFWLQYFWCNLGPTSKPLHR